MISDDTSAAAPSASPCDWKPAGSVLQNPSCPQELLGILAVRPPLLPVPSSGPPLGFVILADPEDLPFYQELAQLRTEPDGWQEMIAAAREFATGSLAFVSRLAGLGTPVAAYPLLACQLRGLQGEVSLEEILVTVETFLFAAGVGPLSSYLESDDLKDVEERVWQSLFAVALGAPAPPSLPDELILVLQVDHFLRELQREWTAGESCWLSPLTQPETRAEVLNATVLLPAGVVPIDPACLSEPPSLGAGWVKALGVGELKRLFQCLRGYELGEVADVVNAMKHERLELSARELTRREEVEETRWKAVDARDEQEERASRSDLRNELEDVVAAEALCSQFNNLTQTFNGTQMTLNGSWQGFEGLQQRSDREARDFAETLTRRAASRVALTVAESRVRRRLREQEWINLRDIDNRQGTTRLLGIYRWLHKVYEMAVRDAGKRLVIEFEIADPAATYLLHLRNLDGVPLVRPRPPESYQVGSWQAVTPAKAALLSSLYQVEVAPPPPAEISLVRSFQSQPPVFQAELEIPDGYAVKTASLSYMLGDESDNLVGFVGNVQVMKANTPATPIPGLLEPPPSSGGSGGTPCPSPTNPFAYLQVPYQPVSSQVMIDPTKLTGRLPVALLTTATWFTASLTLTCALPAGSELMTSWQIRTYDALVAGYLRALERYEAEIRTRIGADGEENRRRIERQQLKLRAFQILGSRRAPEVPVSSPRSLELFERAFAWDEMTYAFHACPPPQEPCLPAPCWTGQVLTNAEADGLFNSFLHARSARVLVPVRPGCAAAVLFYLHFGLPWPGATVAAPVAEPDLPVLADLRVPQEQDDGTCWRIEIPTSMVVLQADSDFPTFPCPLECLP
ncbi:MAG TPA: hypothetical protein VIA62_11230 [Thermoanaerobaculia bacterium]|nr:hypothetical protein [Thermoanaerobaculia bacterium]